ncbi:MAG TPA: class I SAM-dependent methyltransferase [Thermoleophilaceae bacterium]|nr:class I SAM-dependent methyltransferase [Thermoleophilaceae bacterium]
MPIDPLAERAFGARADDYERHRPGWPAEAVEQALAGVGAGPESTVVDLAAGTGKLTRALVPRVARVIAVEPSADMRVQLEARVPEAEVAAGTADALPLGDESVDAVVVGEAFHWFCTPEAVAEIARVVRPGGGLAMLWNAHDFGSEPWVRAMGELLDSRRAPGVTPINRKQTGLWKRVFDDSQFEPLSPPFRMRQEQRTDVDGLVAHISTWSFVGALDEEPRAALQRDLADLLRREHPSPADVAIPYRTDVYWTRRR